MKFNFKKFGEEIKFKRTAGKTTHDKPYGLKDLGKELDIDYTAIWRVENGKGISSEVLISLGKWAELDLYNFIEK